MASELQSAAPIAEVGDDLTASRAWSTRNPCHFVWHELPFDDDSIVEHRVDTYFARVYTQPLNRFPHPATLEQAVDLLIGGDGPGWENQYTDVEDDIIRWDCLDDKDEKKVNLEIVPVKWRKWPLWAQNGTFSIQDWPYYPWEHRPVVSFLSSFNNIPVVGGTAFLTLRLVKHTGDEVDVFATASLRVELPVNTSSPEGKGTRPACRFKWRGEQDDTVKAYLGNVYQQYGIPFDSTKQIVDLRPTVGKATLEVDPVDNLIRWTCRRDRESFLKLSPEDVPEWAEDRFSLETDTGYSEPIVAYEGDLDWSSGLDDAEFNLLLIDTLYRTRYTLDSDSILKTVDLTVSPRKCRLFSLAQRLCINY